MTNGALGQLPLSLLPTASAQASDGNEPLFSGYRTRSVARPHPRCDLCAVGSGIAHAAAIAARARQPAPQFIGFGDPYFSVEQAAAAEC